MKSDTTPLSAAELDGVLCFHMGRAEEQHDWCHNCQQPMPCEIARLVAMALRGLQKDTDEETWRMLLWRYHGHVALYGDDGEMQCGSCMLDYKRISLADLAAHLLAPWVVPTQEAPTDG